MRMRRSTFLVIALGLAAIWFGTRPVRAPAAPEDPQPPSQQAPPANTSEVIRAEANLVLVDVVVTDKKGKYIRDLAAKDFRVLDNDKEQTIVSFSYGTEQALAGTPAQRRYLVLFFDNSTMASADQIRARQAAAQFIEKTASTDRMMAVVDFGGVYRVAQNFTSDTEALKRAVSGVRFASLAPNEAGQTTQIASIGAPSIVQTRTDFAARSSLLAIRNLAKTLRTVPGRKALILFSGGFPLTAERQSELTATIDAANKANVAIYAVDVRGLQGMGPSNFPEGADPSRQRFPGLPPGAGLNGDESPYPHDPSLVASLAGGIVLPRTLAQRPGGGGAGGGAGGGGGRPSGGGQPSGGGGGSPSPSTGGGGTPGGTSTGGTRGGSPGGSGGGPRTTPPPGAGRTGGSSPYDPNNPLGYNTVPRSPIIPQMLDSATTNQQVLHALAEGTGGFTIFNTNDFGAGLTKIAQELGEYYVLGYSPTDQAHDGNFHTIEVKVDRKGVGVRARRGYYDAKSSDLLAGKPEGKALEDRALSPQPSEIPMALTVPYFYSGANVARVNLALEVPGEALNFEKVKGRFHSDVYVLGIASREDGTVAARFSDTVKLDFEKKDQKEFSKGSFPYQNTFEIVPGKYKLKVVLGAGGQKFGKYEIPLDILPYDGKKLHLSAPAISNKVRPIAELTASLDQALLEERAPLVSQGYEVVPSPNPHFKKGETVALYVEVYEPLMAEETPPRVGIIFDVIDRNTNQQVYTSNTLLVNSFAQAGNPVIPVAVPVPVDKLQAGSYRLQVRARNGAGSASVMHTAEFNLE